MSKRGPKSAGELSTVPELSTLPTRPEPPKSLNAWERRRWIDVAAALVVDYFRPSDLELLEQMCVSERMARDCNANLNKHGHVIGGSKGTPVANPAAGLREKYLSRALACQRALRLPPSMRMRTEAAALQKAIQPKARKRPWETKT